MDSRAGELSGSGMSSHFWDTRVPLNINDTQLDPGMREVPVEHNGPTEMVFCLMRYKFGEMLRFQTHASIFHGAWNPVSADTLPLDEKLRIIDEFEARMENHPAFQGDSSIPLQFLAMAVLKSAIYKIRFLASFRKVTGQTSEHPSQVEKDNQFNLALRLFNVASTVKLRSDIQNYMWHIRTHFQWQPFIYILGELRTRTSGNEVENAWQRVAEIYDFFPELINKPFKTLHVAVGNLTLKAWEAYYTAQDLITEEPPFIKALRERRSGSMASRNVENMCKDILLNHSNSSDIDSSELTIATVVDSSLLEQPTNIDFDFSAIDPTSMEWMDWTSLLQENA